MPEEQSDGQPSPSTEELLSFDDAIKFLDTSKSTLYRLLSLEEVKGVKVGKQWRFRKADLTAYVDRSPIATSVNATATGDLDVEAAFFASELAGFEGISIGAAHDNQNKSIELRIVQLTNNIIDLAIASQASDIHLEPIGTSSRLRYRIDGLMHVIRHLPMSLHDSVIARIKEMGDMNLNEKRLPQDGRAIYHAQGRKFDLRISLVPTNFGEAAAVRILDRSLAIKSLDRFGMSGYNLGLLRASLSRPGGFIVATGPSGSGRTHLVYSCLMEVNSPSIKVMTVEEIIEYQLAGITQIQSRPRIGVTVAAGMRSAMRQDPDVILCSDIRDQETAEIALQGAITGVSVLSTILGNSSVGVIERLSEMGIERFLITASLNAIVSTRFLRLLCPHCKTRDLDEDSLPMVGKITHLAARGGYSIPSGTVFYTSEGCEKCRGTGYQGRTSIFEILVCSPRLVSNLMQCSTEDEMVDLAVKSGMRTLFADGMLKAVAGETSISEVLRVTDTTL